MCAQGFASGTAAFVNASFSYANGGSPSLISNILAMSVKFVDADVGDCIQIGGANEQCNHLFAWGSSLQFTAPGMYNVLVDVQSAEYEFANGEYEICIGNGDQIDDTSYAGFVGDATILGLTTQPVSTLTVTSDNSESLEVSYDLSIQSGQYMCTEGFAEGSAQFVNVSFDYSSASASSISSILAMSVKFVDAEVGDCIQIGGTLSMCNNLFAWGDALVTSSSGSYNVMVDVSSANYEFPNGHYQICMGNGDQQDPDSYAGFSGDATVLGLTSQPDSSVSITSAESEMMEASFDLSIQSGQFVCASGFAEGHPSSITVNFTYANGGSTTQISQFLAMSVKFKEAAVGDCIQIGGALSMCTHLFAWGASLQSSAPGAYSAVVDVSSAEYSFPNGEYEICFGNGDQDNSEAYAGLAGAAVVAGLISQPESAVEVTSTNGNTMAVSYDLSLQSGQYMCAQGFASGTAAFVNASFSYANGGSPSLISNILAMSVKFVDADVGDCIQIGGANEQCNHLFAWGSSLQFTAPGMYNVLVDVQSAEYEFANGEYEICIGNGDQIDDTSYAGFVGDATILGLTTQPLSTLTVTSDNSESLEVSYDLSIQSGQYMCTEGFAEGSAQFVNVSFDYSSASASSISSILAMSVKFVDAEVGDCIQIGGTLSMCNNLFAWGDALVTSSSGSYNVMVDVSSANYEFPNGHYQICMGNGDQQDPDSYAGFSGDATVLGLTSQPDSSVSITSAESEMMEASFDLSIQSGQFVCASGFAEGHPSSITVNFTYANGGSTTQISQFLAMSVKFKEAAVGDCIQIGGALSMCTHLFAWGASLQSIAPGSYSAVVDVSSAEYSFPNGEYEICFGNGDQDNSEAYAGLAGAAVVAGLISQPESAVEVTSTNGNTMAVSYDLSLQSGQYMCAQGFASGTAAFVNASFSYANGGSPSLISNILAMSVKFVDAGVGDCIQIGGANEQCNHLFAWGSSLQFTAPGMYNVLVDVQSAEYEFANGEYEICIGNGDQIDDTSYAGFVGDATILGLTTQPVSTLTVTSDNSESLEVSYDLSIQSGQYMCTEGFAEGSAQFVNVSFDYSSASASSISSILAMSVKFVDAEVGDCIQIGGTLSMCNNLFAWGDALVTSSSGSYNVMVDVSSANYEFPNGHYQICMGNGDQQDPDSYAGFSGDATVLGLTSQPDSSVSITSAESEMMEASFDLSIQSGQFVCASGFAEGSPQYVNVSFSYANGGSSSLLSDILVMSVKFVDANIGDCIQIGGATEHCNHLFAWGSSLQFTAPGMYNVLVDVQSAEYEFANGEYEICIGNGDQIDDTSYAGFVGDATVLGLTTQPLSTLTVTSDNSESLEVSYDLSIQSGQYMCTEGFAEGSAQFVNVSFDYANGGSPSLLSNILAMSVKFVDAEVGDCIQIGGGTEMCNHLYSWGSSLQFSSPGSYSVMVDVSSANYEFPNGDYQICLGNGDQLDDTSYAGFIGDALVLGLTSQPLSTVAVVSEPSEAFEVAYDLSIQSGQYICASGFAEGTAAFFNVSFTYSNGGTTSDLSQFLAMSLKFQDADAGDCIQFGGATEKCNHLYSWDSSLQSSSSGSYQVLIDIQDAEYEFPNGNYEICVGNGDQQDSESYAGFVGGATVVGLTSQPVSSLSVSSDDGETLETTYDLSVKSGQYVCTTGVADGSVNAVNVSFAYANGGSVSSVGNILAMSIKFTDATIGDCIQIGGGTEMCNHVYSWDSSFQSSLPGDYHTVVDVSSAGYDFTQGEYEMCMGNGDQQDSTSYAGFNGVNEFVGLASVCLF